MIRRRLVHRLALAAVLLPVGASGAGAVTFTVTNTNDSGTNSLRWAIQQANATAAADVIAFAIAGSGTRVIALATPLPSIGHPVTIDGTTQSGWAGTPIVRVDGQDAAGQFWGFDVGADGTTIRGLQIVRFAGPGIRVWSTGNTFAGNFIGTDGTNELGNSGAGIVLYGGSNTIGGTAANAGNTISGNGGNGITIDDASAGNTIQGNRIGTSSAGTAAVPNGGGIAVWGDGNTIGGTSAAARNQVSGNAWDGIVVGEGADGNLVLGNYLGTNATGNAALGNVQSGIALRGANNAVGGTAAGAGNLISGNGSSGVRIDDVAQGNFVLGNRIGTNAAGTAAVPNQGGILLYGDDNTIGGTDAASRNLISGNGYDGIGINGDATGNEILGNWIGLDAAGTGKIGNDGYGIRIVDGHDNTIGGTAAGAGNVVSGNGRGLSLEYDSHHYTVQGNVFGLNAAATAKVASPGTGIEIGSPDHLIGGTEAGAGNVLAGHGYYGIALLGGGAHGVRIEGNWIGTNSSGAAGLGNNYSGVLISEAFGNTIGGTEPGAGNTIAHNGYLGVLVGAGSGNAILGNSIHSNVLLGIDLEPQGPFANDALDADLGANLGQNFPVVTSAVVAGLDLEINGFLDSKPEQEYRIELFSNPGFDPTGIGEGRHFLGAVTVTTDAAGHAEFATSLTAAGGDAFVAATATDAGGNTSEHSPAIAVGAPQPGQLQIWRDVLLSYEGTPGVEVAVVRSHGVAGSVSVDVATADFTAFAPGDYGAVDTTLTFAPGEVVKTVFVPVVTDAADENDEKYYVDLSAPTGGAVLGAQSHVLAWLFDASPDWPMFSITDAQVVEGDGGTKKLVFTVTRSPSPQARTVDYWTTDGNATAGDDYVAVEGQVVFAGGDLEETIEIDVLGDTLAEPDEALYLHLYPQGQSICWDCTGEGLVVDDDDPNHLFSDDFESGDVFEWSAAQGQL